MITKAKYTEETLNWVSLELEDGTVAQTTVTDGIRRQYTDDLQEFLDNGGVIDPQFTQDEINKIEQDKTVQAARTYLKDTDWYVIRSVERAIAIPDLVITNRANAIQEINNVNS